MCLLVGHRNTDFREPGGHRFAHEGREGSSVRFTEFVVMYGTVERVIEDVVAGAVGWKRYASFQSRTVGAQQ